MYAVHVCIHFQRALIFLIRLIGLGFNYVKTPLARLKFEEF